jgi:hypothetical protein
MLDWLKSFSGSRKVVLAVVTAVLVYANRRFGLGLGEADITAICVATGSAVIGLAIQDHGKASAAAAMNAQRNDEPTGLTAGGVGAGTSPPAPKGPLGVDQAAHAAAIESAKTLLRAAGYAIPYMVILLGVDFGR